jgi:serine/threonine protein kinase
MLLRLFCCTLVSTVMILTSLQATQANQEIYEKSLHASSIKTRIKRAHLTKKYTRLGKFLKKSVRTENNLKTIQKLALKYRAGRLLYATRFALATHQKKQNMSLKPGDLLQIGLFIETKAPYYVKKGRYYLKKEVTHLSHTIEYDPLTQNYFILLDKVKGAHLGQGAAKKVTKSVRYSRKQPEIIARAEQHYRMVRELNLMRILNGAPGLFVTRAFTSHIEKNKVHSTVYSDLYNPGSLESAFDQGYRFSLKDKLKIAIGLVRGLGSLRERNIIHRDLRAANCFINISPSKIRGAKNVTAVIADFGCSKVVTEANHIIANANRINTAPEGLILSKMQGQKYFGTDLFAIGCVLYRLNYGECPPWRLKEYFDFDERTAEEKSRFLAEKITENLNTKYARLDKKDPKTLTQRQQFEYVILRMLDPDPEKRGTPQELHHDLIKIYKRKGDVASVEREKGKDSTRDEAPEISTREADLINIQPAEVADVVLPNTVSFSEKSPLNSMTLKPEVQPVQNLFTSFVNKNDVPRKIYLVRSENAHTAPNNLALSDKTKQINIQLDTTELAHRISFAPFMNKNFLQEKLHPSSVRYIYKAQVGHTHGKNIFSPSQSIGSQAGNCKLASQTVTELKPPMLIAQKTAI